MNVIEGLRRLYVAVSVVVVVAFGLLAYSDGAPSELSVQAESAGRLTTILYDEMWRDDALPNNVLTRYDLRNEVFPGMTDGQIVSSVCASGKASKAVEEECASARNNIDSLYKERFKHALYALGISLFVAAVLFALGKTLMWIATGFTRKS